MMDQNKFPVGMPSTFVYMATKAEKYLRVGADVYRAEDFFHMPRQNWPESLLEVVQRGMKQICELRGWSRLKPFEGLGIDGFYALMSTLHFKCEQQFLINHNDTVYLDEMYMQHQVTEQEIVLYNEVPSPTAEIVATSLGNQSEAENVESKMNSKAIIDAYEKVRSSADDNAHEEYTDDGYWISVNRYGQALQVLAVKDGDINEEISRQLRLVVGEYVSTMGRALSEEKRKVTPEHVFLKWFEGICPQCRLEGQETIMIINESDYYECPDCRLQVCGISSLHMIIIHMRGKGSLKLDSTSTVDLIEHPTGRILCEEDHGGDGNYYFPCRPGEFIDKEAHLRSYLAKIK